jgi:hypothetical protein
VSSKDAEAREFSPQEQALGKSTFDEVAKGLAQGTITRGRALRLVGAGLVSTILGSIVGPGIAEAAPTCPSGGPGCNARCKHTSGQNCICVKLANGNTRCVFPFCGPPCTKNANCPSGWVCSKTARKCCGTSSSLCVPLCNTSTSAATSSQRASRRWNQAA